MAASHSSGPAQTTPLPAPKQSHWLFFSLLFLVALVYIGASFTPVLFDETEGQYAGAAWEMLQSHHWLTPTNDGMPRLQKPPLLYWLLCLSISLFGKTEFAARLPNALATLGWIYVVYLIGERISGFRRGVAAAGIFGSMVGVFIFSHLIMPEPFLGLFISLTFWSFLSGWRQPEKVRRWFLTAWIFMALGVMVKGLHGALYPLTAVLTCAALLPSTRPFWRGLCSLKGIGLFLAIVVPWYLVMAISFPGFLVDHFVNEQIGHSLDQRFPRDSEPVPFAMFWAQHLVFFFPWTLFAPAALWAWYRSRAFVAAGVTPTPVDRRGLAGSVIELGSRNVRMAFRFLASAATLLQQALRRGPADFSQRQPAGVLTANLHPLFLTRQRVPEMNPQPQTPDRTPERLLLIWILLTAISVMFSARQDYYTLTAWAPLAVLLALPWASPTPPPRTFFVVPCVFLALLGIAAVLCSQIALQPAPPPAVSGPSTAQGNLFSSLSSVSSDARQDCAALLGFIGLFLLAGGGVGAYLAFRRKPGPAGLAVALTMTLCFASFVRGYSLMGHFFSLADGAKAINATAAKDAIVVCEGEPHLNSSLFYYLDRRVHWVDANPDNEFSVRALHVGNELYVSGEKLASLWQSRRQIFLIVEHANLPRWKDRLSLNSSQTHPLASSGSRIVLVNH